jgi:hypothetical protein
MARSTNPRTRSGPSLRTLPSTVSFRNLVLESCTQCRVGSFATRTWRDLIFHFWGFANLVLPSLKVCRSSKRRLNDIGGCSTACLGYLTGRPAELMSAARFSVLSVLCAGTPGQTLRPSEHVEGRDLSPPRQCRGFSTGTIGHLPLVDRGDDLGRTFNDLRWKVVGIRQCEEPR